jgi:hypothetical protein
VAWSFSPLQNTPRVIAGQSVVDVAVQTGSSSALPGLGWVQVSPLSPNGTTAQWSTYGADVQSSLTCGPHPDDGLGE